MSNEKDKQSSFCICVIPVCLRANGMYTSSLCPIQPERLGRMCITVVELPASEPETNGEPVRIG